MKAAIRKDEQSTLLPLCCVLLRERNSFKLEKLQHFFLLPLCVTIICLLPGRFVSDVVHIYYTSDEKVQGDEEIQAFVKDVCSFGMQDLDSCGETLFCTSLLLVMQHPTKYTPTYHPFFFSRGEKTLTRPPSLASFLFFFFFGRQV